MIRTVIIEDETAAAINLRSLLRQEFPNTEVLCVLESIGESIEWLRANRPPDLIFMDIHLADGESFRIFDAVEVTAPVIFTTAYDQYALEAFRVNSIDYLLKPINAADLHRAIEKLLRLTGLERRAYGEQVRRLTARAAAPRTQQVFLSHVRDRIIPLHRDSIAFFYTANERVSATAFDGESYPLDRTLEALQALLPESDYFRANRQFIVSRQAVRDISVWFGGRLSLNLTVATPERIFVSKARVPEFKQWLTAAHGGE